MGNRDLSQEDSGLTETLKKCEYCDRTLPIFIIERIKIKYHLKICPTCRQEDVEKYKGLGKHLRKSGPHWPDTSDTDIRYHTRYEDAKGKKILK